LRILISNDDGYLSPGLYLLYDAVRDLGETVIVSTEFPRSATGREITFGKPLRFTETSFMGYKVYVTDGTPIDALHLAIEVLDFKPDIVLSGVNVGDNLSLQHIFYSGTIAVAIEAALMGVSAVAFSADIREFSEFEDPKLKSIVEDIARKLVKYLNDLGMPQGVDVLSVNIPRSRNFRGCVRVVRAARLRWSAAYRAGTDPRGRKYYWLYGVPAEACESTDVTAFEKGCVTVTPLSIDLNVSSCVLESVKNLEQHLRSDATSAASYKGLKK